MIKQHCIGSGRDRDRSMINIWWLIQILDGGWNEGFKGSLDFQRGEGRVRSRWGEIRFWLPFAVFLTCTIAPD